MMEVAKETTIIDFFIIRSLFGLVWRRKFEKCLG